MLVRKGRSKKKQKDSNSESEEEYTGSALCRQYAGGRCPDTYNPLTAGYSGSPPLVLPNHRLPYTDGYNPANDQPPMSGSHAGLPDPPAAGSVLPGRGASSLGWDQSLTASGSGTAGGNVHVRVVHTPGGVDQAAPYPDNLCSDSPIDGLTALSNGTIVVFKGEHFWLVDPVSRSQGLPRSIADTLGVPSPIDAAFTRCNCHSTVYIIKGEQCWRLDENLLREPGYPKPLASEFPPLSGNITAALPFPATGGSPETVFFFRNGDVVQRFTFPPGSAPPCKKTPAGSVQRRAARQAEVLLSQEINIKVSLEGFPTPVTSALSVSSPGSTHQYQQYQHYVFSGPLFFRVQVSGELPVLFQPDPSTAFTAASLFSSSAVAPNPEGANPPPPPAPPAPANSFTRWLRCP
ncbi:proteoglycan 4a [Nelusetta ayraudi]|uniref:proteoglycan 4a n=1 Tax=Nelusetta ayraudi TaxID=303726 RepID=UPI003F70B188